MTHNQAPLLLEEAAQAAALELVRHPVIEVTVARRGRRLTSYTMEGAIREVVKQAVSADDRARDWARVLDKMRVEIKDQSAEAVTFCVYR